MARIRSVTGHVHAIQELRRSNAAGPHVTRRARDDEPCLCATNFTCLAEVHDDSPDPEAA